MSTVVFGPSGGVGGQPFDDEPPAEHAKVRELRVWAGAQVDAIQTVLDVDGEAVEGVKHGGNSGNLSVLTLGDNEYITEVYGRFGSYIEILNIRTNKGQSRRFGGQGGIIDFLYVAPSGFQIIGFWGRSGRLIDSLGVHIAPVPAP